MLRIFLDINEKILYNINNLLRIYYYIVEVQI